MSNILFDAQQTRDAINPIDRDGDNQVILRMQEDINIEELSTIISQRDTSTDTIWGLFNWGSSNWDGAYANSLVVIRVINANNTWRDYLRDTDFVDTGSTTATVSTANFDITFTGVQTYQTVSIFTNSKTIIQATLKIDTTNITSAGNLTYYLSANGGSNWETVTLDTEHTFTNTGTDLRLKIVSSANAAIDIDDSDGYSTAIIVEYKITG